MCVCVRERERERESGDCDEPSVQVHADSADRGWAMGVDIPTYHKYV